MNRDDPLVKGEMLGGQFNYHALDVAGPPMIHVTRSRIPEIVVFGPAQQLVLPLAVNAGNAIMVTALSGNEITVSKYSAHEGDQKRTVSPRVDEVIRAIVELGGTYPDVVQALQEAKAGGALTSRFEIDALPEPGRTYDRIAGEEDHEDAAGTRDGKAEAAKVSPARAVPELFAKKGGTTTDAASNTAADAKEEKPDGDDSTPDEEGLFC